MRHGQGRFEGADGSVYAGRWDEDRPPRVCTITGCAATGGNLYNPRLLFKSRHFASSLSVPERGRAARSPIVAEVAQSRDVQLHQRVQMDRFSGKEEEAFRPQPCPKSAGVVAFSAPAGPTRSGSGVLGRSTGLPCGSALRASMLPVQSNIQMRHCNPCPASHQGVQHAAGAVLLEATEVADVALLHELAPPASARPQSAPPLKLRSRGRGKALLAQPGSGYYGGSPSQRAASQVDSGGIRGKDLGTRKGSDKTARKGRKKNVRNGKMRVQPANKKESTDGFRNDAPPGRVFHLGKPRDLHRAAHLFWKQAGVIDDPG